MADLGIPTGEPKAEAMLIPHPAPAQRPVSPEKHYTPTEWAAKKRRRKVAAQSQRRQRR